MGGGSGHGARCDSGMFWQETRKVPKRNVLLLEELVAHRSVDKQTDSVSFNGSSFFRTD